MFIPYQLCVSKMTILLDHVKLDSLKKNHVKFPKSMWSKFKISKSMKNENTCKHICDVSRGLTIRHKCKNTPCGLGLSQLQNISWGFNSFL